MLLCIFSCCVTQIVINSSSSPEKSSEFFLVSNPGRELPVVGRCAWPPSTRSVKKPTAVSAIDGTNVLSPADLKFYLFIYSFISPSCSSILQECECRALTTQHLAGWELTSVDDMDSQEITVDLARVGTCN